MDINYGYYPEDMYCDNLSESSEKKKKNKDKVSDFLVDKNYLKTTIKYKDESGFIKKRKFAFYKSGIVGCKIRNAESGILYPHIVGSPDEDLYFKVTTSFNINGTQTSFTLFYDSPQQYEVHNLTKLKDEIKEKWRQKKDKRLINISK